MLRLFLYFASMLLYNKIIGFEMKKIKDVIKYVRDLAQNIKSSHSAKGVDKEILSYVEEEQIPYKGLLGREQKILKDLEKIKSDSALGSELAETFKGYLAEHPIVTEYGGPGSHVDISQAAINNGFVFVLGLVVTSLVATELVTER